MKIDLLKDKVQNEAIKAILKNKGRGTICAATGVGKSRIPILYIKNDPNIKNIALIVPTEILRDVVWEKEFSEWNEKELYNTLDRYCYASISNIKGKKYDLVILDECHHITSENFSFFRNNTIKDIIGLTATFPKTFLKKNLLLSLNLKPVYTITLTEATDKDLVSKFKIKVFYTKLNNTSKNIMAGNSKKRFYQTEYSAYKFLDSQINRLKNIEISNDFHSNQKRLKMLLLKRARFIYNLKSKTEAAKSLLKKLDKEDRVLIFCGSINQAEELHYQTYHSKTNKDFYNLFKQEKINWLSCVNSLNEGDNISNLDKAVIVQLNSNDLNLIQRIGRVIRKRPDHEAIIYIFCAKDTQDEIWLNRNLESFDPNIIEHINLF